MNVIILLALILLILMVFVGGRKGARSFFSFFINFIVILLTVFFMLDPLINPIVITFIACIIIGVINLFFINRVNTSTVTAFIATMITISLLLFIIYTITKMAMVQGFGEEESDSIGAYSLFIGVDFVKIATSVVIMSTIGAIIDVAISITSSMQEIFHHNQKLSRKELFYSGLRIGRDILGVEANTLFFAFFGGYLGLLIWYKDLAYTFGEIVNSKVFGAEFIMICTAGMGIAFIIPITAWICSIKMGVNDNKE